MIFPVQKPFRIGKGYGAIMPYGIHHGVDILPDTPGVTGAPILSMDEGTVMYAGRTPICGKRVDIAYINGTRSRYCHLDKVLVNTGDDISKGKKVGTMGHTGLVYPRSIFGTHLHYVLFNKRGVAVDPMTVDYEEGDSTDVISHVNQRFREVFKRDPARGESLYFQIRIAQRSIKDEEDLLEKLYYWKGIAEEDDKRWQREKARWIRKMRNA